MRGTPTQRFTVANLDQWGRLVKSWATNLNYIDCDYKDQPPRTCWVNKTWPSEEGGTPAPATIRDHVDGVPRPWCLPHMKNVDVSREDGQPVHIKGVAMKVEDFKARVGDAGVTILLMPEQYKNVVIVQGSEDVMIVRLPPKTTLQSSEDDLLNGAAYNLPQFYSKLYESRPNPPTDQSGIMKLHANRIGEYTLNVCN